MQIYVVVVVFMRKLNKTGCDRLQSPNINHGWLVCFGEYFALGLLGPFVQTLVRSAGQNIFSRTNPYSVILKMFLSN